LVANRSLYGTIPIAQTIFKFAEGHIDTSNRYLERTEQIRINNRVILFRFVL